MLANGPAVTPVAYESGAAGGVVVAVGGGGGAGGCAVCVSSHS